MQRFILERNIARYEVALEGNAGIAERKVIGDLLAAARDELAALDRLEHVQRRAALGLPPEC